VADPRAVLDAGASVAGYHEHLVRRLEIARRRHLSAEALLVPIRAVYAANRGDGWPRIWRELHAQASASASSVCSGSCSSTVTLPARLCVRL
jgi:hypothetical protein